MFFKCVIVALVASSAWARTTGTTHNSIQETPRSEETTSYLSDLRYVYKVYQECAATDLSSCLKLKLVAAMERVARAYSDVNIFEGVSFVKDPNAPAVSETPKSESELEATLPRSLNEKDTALNNLIAERVSNFFDSHTLQVKLPSASELQRSFSGEARKKKKGSSMLLLPMILAGTLVPLALGGLALLAGKALIVSKLALVLAAIIGLKKLLGGGGGGHDSGHVEVLSSGGHSGWGRSYDKEAAQKLAYSAYPAKSER